MSAIEISAIESMFVEAQGEMARQAMDPSTLDVGVVVHALNGPNDIYDASSIGCHQHSEKGPLTDEALDTARELVEELNGTRKRLQRPSIARDVAGAAFVGTAAGGALLVEMGARKYDVTEARGEEDDVIGDRILEENDLVYDDSLVDGVLILEDIPGIPDFADQIDMSNTAAEVSVDDRGDEVSGDTPFAIGGGVVGTALLLTALLRSRGRYVHRRAKRMAQKAGMQL